MEGYRREAVWDPFTRAWHWVLAASVITGWMLGEFRTFSIMQWHIYLGYLTGALLVLRYVWGWVGPAPVRHRTLLASLRGMPAYVRRIGARRPSGVPGHNPVGALSVIAMVLALTAQVVTGLFSQDDALFYSGPLASEVSSDTVVMMTGYHNLFARVVLVLVALHLAAILYYLVWKRENLVASMWHGRKWVKDRATRGE
ncbi:MAG: cytochrome b/b6 domain-containing protein [Thiotrichales bacterium]|nr:cytochrome b/b6 domain-containing protein [Thiotrichales bacterium]MCY4349886.1 cytochrome b/b6 domain-containing protein [Thiotrichales bacterium]